MRLKFWFLFYVIIRRQSFDESQRPERFAMKNIFQLLIILSFSTLALAASETVSIAVPDVGKRSVVAVEPEMEDRCSLSLKVPIADIQQLWTPDMIAPFLGRKWWISKPSAPQSSMPCISYFNLAERNRFFFGANVLEWDCQLDSKINQEQGVYDIKLTVVAGAGCPSLKFPTRSTPLLWLWPVQNGYLK